VSGESRHIRLVVGIVSVVTTVSITCVLVLWPKQDEATSAPAQPEILSAKHAPGPSTEALAKVLDTQLSAQERDQSLDDIKGELTPEEVEQVRELAKDRKLNLAFRNDVLLLLERQEQKPEWLGPELVRMWKDKEEHETWRDYCLQHMELAYDYATNRDEIASVLKEVALGGGRISGTALLSLERLGKRYPALGETAKAIARDTVLAEKLDAEAAVTAMQVAREAEDTTVLDTARRLAADKGALVRLRMSSIGTLGELGAAADLALLERLAADPEKRVSRVAKYNLDRLRKMFAR